MIFISIGANLPSPVYGSPKATCESALDYLGEQEGINVDKVSRWYRTAPVPVSDQPWYVNGICAITTGLTPEQVMSVLLEIEDHFGRTRSIKNAARILDLDLIAYNDVIKGWPFDPEGDPTNLVLPHPRLHERAFVLLPIGDIAPDWVHPATGILLKDMIDLLDKEQQALPEPDETV